MSGVSGGDGSGVDLVSQCAADCNAALRDARRGAASGGRTVHPARPMVVPGAVWHADGMLLLAPFLALASTPLAPLALGALIAACAVLVFSRSRRSR